MTNTAAAEIARLEQALAERDARIAALEQQLAERVSDPVQMVRTVVPRVEYPTCDELRQLHDIVAARWPATVAKKGPAESLRAFTAALVYLAANVSHADRPTQYAMSFWIDRANDHLRQIGRSAHVSPGAIAAAACALGFQHTPFEGSGWDLWISEGAYKLPDPSYWRSLLSGAPLRDPVEVRRRKLWDPTTGRGVTITGGDGRVGQGPIGPRGAQTW
jgi:hypothetical protein